jgi:hypothetical protein
LLKRRSFLAASLLASCMAAPARAAAPGLMLAEVYRRGMPLEGYWVSEKYDGVRAVWDGTTLRHRSGRSIPAPDWFTASAAGGSLPDATSAVSEGGSTGVGADCAKAGLVSAKARMQARALKVLFRPSDTFPRGRGKGMLQ